MKLSYTISQERSIVLFDLFDLFENSFRKAKKALPEVDLIMIFKR